MSCAGKEAEIVNAGVLTPGTVVLIGLTIHKMQPASLGVCNIV